MRRSLFFVFLFFGGATLYFYHSYRSKQLHLEKKAPLQIIAQMGFEKEVLRTDYLAELMGLSCDPQTSAFDQKRALRGLLSSPLIQKAKLKRLSSNVLSVDYSLRKPYVFLGEFENVVLDREGYPFPFFPFYTPKNLPRLYLGERSICWNTPVQARQFAFEILDYLEGRIDLFKVEILDVSRTNDPLVGRREVVVVIKEGDFKQMVRLSPTNYQKGIDRYFLIERCEGSQIIDLRLEKFAFIKRCEDDRLYSSSMDL